MLPRTASHLAKHPGLPGDLFISKQPPRNYATQQLADCAPLGERCSLRQEFGRAFTKESPAADSTKSQGLGRCPPAASSDQFTPRPQQPVWLTLAHPEEGKIIMPSAEDKCRHFCDTLAINGRLDTRSTIFQREFRVTLIKNRLPSAQQLLAVYGVITVVVYGWTAFWTLWKFPSWLFFMQWTEILATLSYVLVTNLLESLCVLAVPFAVCLALPSRWFKEAFIASGSTLAIGILLVLAYLANQLAGMDVFYPRDALHQLPVIGLVILVASFLMGRIGVLRKVAEYMADRAAIFPYLTLPLSGVSLVAVIIRIIL
jgi:hypothetical protein